MLRWDHPLGADMSVILGGKSYPVVLPETFSARADVTTAMLRAGSAAHRVYGAMVGVCVPGLKLSAKLQSSGFDMLVYGGAVVDELIARDIAYQEVIDAAVEISRLLNEDLATEKEVEETATFTPPSGESSTLSP